MVQRPVAARVLQGVAFALTIAVALAVLFLPTYASETSSAGSGSPDGPVVTEGLTALAVNGPAILVPLLIPVFLTGLPFLVRGKPWKGVSIAATVLLAAFAVLGLASIGLFYLPALVASTAALLVRPPAKPTAAS